MATFLFDKIIFGPVQSRRLGISLGINLLPETHKMCNFNCIYCECGWNENTAKNKKPLPTADQVIEALHQKLQEMQSQQMLLDVITFAGNGEPTLHSDFPKIIDATLLARDKYFPEAQIAVLSNGTRADDPDIFNALRKVDRNILKLDPGTEETCKMINKPSGNFSLQQHIEKLRKFNGHLIVQSLFVKGNYQGKDIDTSTGKDLVEWLRYIKQIAPREVMIYTIERDTAAPGLSKVPREQLENIAADVKKLGIATHIAG